MVVRVNLMTLFTGLSTVWQNQTASSALKARLIESLIWPIVTYAAEAWTLMINIEAFDMQWYRKALWIAYTEYISNEDML